MKCGKAHLLALLCASFRLASVSINDGNTGNFVRHGGVIAGLVSTSGASEYLRKEGGWRMKEMMRRRWLSIRNLLLQSETGPGTQPRGFSHQSVTVGSPHFHSYVAQDCESHALSWASLIPKQLNATLRLCSNVFPSVTIVLHNLLLKSTAALVSGVH